MKLPQRNLGFWDEAGFIDFASNFPTDFPFDALPDLDILPEIDWSTLPEIQWNALPPLEEIPMPTDDTYVSEFGGTIEHDQMNYPTWESVDSGVFDYVDDAGGAPQDFSFDEPAQPIIGEPPSVVTDPPAVITRPGDYGIDISKVLQTAAGIVFKYVQGTNGTYTPQGMPPAPAGTRYDASGRLVSATTGYPVQVDRYGRIVNTGGSIVPSGQVRYDIYGRPVSPTGAPYGTPYAQPYSGGFSLNNLPAWALPAGIAALGLLAIVSMKGKSK